MNVKVERLRIEIGRFEDDRVQCKFIQYNKFQPNGMKTISRSIQVLNVLSMIQEITLKNSVLSAHGEGYIRRVHQTYSECVCRHLLHCQIEPLIRKNSLFSSEECISGERTTNFPAL